jgi:hypothetical protein
MKLRPAEILESLAELVRRYPKMSATAAFELGIMIGGAVRAARRGAVSDDLRGRLRDVVPLIPRVRAPTRRPRKRKPAARHATTRKPSARRGRARKPKAASAEAAAA